MLLLLDEEEPLNVAPRWFAMEALGRGVLGSINACLSRDEFEAHAVAG